MIETHTRPQWPVDDTMPTKDPVLPTGGLQRGGRGDVLVANLDLGAHGAIGAGNGDPVNVLYEASCAQQAIV